VALKLFVNSKSMGEQLDHELKMYKRISSSSTKHPGRGAVRELLDSFDVPGPDGCHRCLVHPPLWESVLTFLHRNPVRRLPAPVLAFVLRRLLLALDFLHTECQIIHTGAYEGTLPSEAILRCVPSPAKNGAELLWVRHQIR
jgi:serine/threonine-protein kinase SRPK3